MRDFEFSSMIARACSRFTRRGNNSRKIRQTRAIGYVLVELLSSLFIIIQFIITVVAPVSRFPGTFVSSTRASVLNLKIHA